MTVPAIARFVKLMTDIDGGVKVVSSLTDVYAFHYDTVELDLIKLLLINIPVLKSVMIP